MNQKETLYITIIEPNKTLLSKLLNGREHEDIRFRVFYCRDIEDVKGDCDLIIISLPHVDDFTTHTTYFANLVRINPSAVLLCVPEGNTEFTNPLPQVLAPHLSTIKSSNSDIKKIVQEIHALYQRCKDKQISWKREEIFPMDLLAKYHHDVIDKNRASYFPENDEEKAKERLEQVRTWLQQLNGQDELGRLGINMSSEEIETLNTQKADQLLQKIAGYRVPYPSMASHPQIFPASKERKRILIIDDDWNEDYFWPRYVYWDINQEWEFIFADFSLQEFVFRRSDEKKWKEDLDLLNLLFFESAQTSGEDEGELDRLIREKFFVILLDNFYGDYDEELELGRLFFDACIGNDEDSELKQRMIDRDDEQIRKALDTIDNIRALRESGKVFLPKIVLLSGKEIEYSTQGHIKLRKKEIRENHKLTQVVLKALHGIALGRFVNTYYDSTQIAQRIHLANYGEFKGVSQVARKIYRQIEKAREARDVSVLILGESGTGKELIAREIAKGRFMVYLRNLKTEKFDGKTFDTLVQPPSKPGLPDQSEAFKHLFDCYFKSINIGAMTVEGNLMEAELFGKLKDYPRRNEPARPSLFEFVPPEDTEGNSLREKTLNHVCDVVGIELVAGKTQKQKKEFEEQKKALEEQANEVVVFMDELGEAPSMVQVGLLRLLQEHNVTPLPTSSGVKIDVNFKLISATNANLKERIADGDFRSDLYYRISDIVIDIPSLSERPEDIPVLIETFIERWVKKFAHDFWKLPPNMKAEALFPKQFHWDDYALLLRYSWPGNVRELEQTVKQSLLYTYYKEREAIDFVTVELDPDKKKEIEEKLA